MKAKKEDESFSFYMPTISIHHFKQDFAIIINVIKRMQPSIGRLTTRLLFLQYGTKLLEIALEHRCPVFLETPDFSEQER